jgi:hypothetical protein
VIDYRWRLFLLECGFGLLQRFARGFQIPTRRLLCQRLLRQGLDLCACLLERLTALRGGDTRCEKDCDSFNQYDSFHGYLP